MKDLIERLEKATGPDRELDVAIYLAEFPRPCVEMDNTAQAIFDRYKAPAYTSSIDAALTLVPEGFSVHMEIMTNGRSFCFVHSNELVKQSHAPGAFEVRERKTPALAICIAALKARQHSPATTADK